MTPKTKKNTKADKATKLEPTFGMIFNVVRGDGDAIVFANGFRLDLTDTQVAAINDHCKKELSIAEKKATGKRGS